MGITEMKLNYIESKQKFETTYIKERNRSIHAARRDWTIVCCDALPRLLVYVIEGSESAEKLARAGEGNMFPPPPPLPDASPLM